jgi:hypothetical protein
VRRRYDCSIAVSTALDDRVVVDAVLVPHVMHGAWHRPEMNAHVTEHRVSVSDARAVPRLALAARSRATTPCTSLGFSHDHVCTPLDPNALTAFDGASIARPPGLAADRPVRNSAQAGSLVRTRSLACDRPGLTRQMSRAVGGSVLALLPAGTPTRKDAASPQWRRRNVTGTTAPGYPRAYSRTHGELGHCV